MVDLARHEAAPQEALPLLPAEDPKFLRLVVAWQAKHLTWEQMIRLTGVMEADFRGVFTSVIEHVHDEVGRPLPR